MNPFHCSKCDKVLGMIEGKAEIKCPRCKTMNLGITVKAWMEEHASTNPPGLRIPCTAHDIIHLDPKEGTALLNDKKSFITLGEFDEAYKKVLPKIKEDWDKLMNEEHPLAKLLDDTDAWTDKFKVVYSTDKDNWRGVEKPEVIEMEIRCLQGVEPPPINHEWATTNGLGANKKTYKLLQIISQENVQGINYNHDDDKFEPTIWTEYKCKVEQIK